LRLRKLLILGLLILSSFCYGQLKHFSKNFKADSTGSNGFREKSISLTTSKNTTLVNGVDLVGYTKKKLISLLGNPTIVTYSSHDTLWWLYLLSISNNKTLTIQIINTKVSWVSSFQSYCDAPNNNPIATDNGISYTGNINPRIGKIRLMAYPKIIAKIKGTDTLHTNIIDSSLHLSAIDVSFKDYIRTNTNYPEVELDYGITGDVYLTFILEKDGSVSNAKVLRHVPGGPGLDKEALRIITNIPKLSPHIEKGKQIEVKYLIGIHFELR
jgi:TonB family protein